MRVISCVSHFRTLETAGKCYPLALYFSLNALTAINHGLVTEYAQLAGRNDDE